MLPLDRHKIKKIAVIGQRATEVLQDWYAGKPFYTVNVLDAIREEAGNDIEVRYVKTNRMAAHARLQHGQMSLLYVSATILPAMPAGNKLPS